MQYEIIEVTKEEKDKLYKLLQYALYDGSNYIDNELNNGIEDVFIFNNKRD